MSDARIDIAAEREAAQAALAAAEQAMEAEVANPRAFKAAKLQRQDALEALERLDWAAQVEQKRQAEHQHQAKLDKLHDAQRGAKDAHGDAVVVMGQVSAMADRLAEFVKTLQTLQNAVNVGVNYETFAVREQLLDKPTVQQRVAVDKEAAVLILRAGRELCRLAGMHPVAADQQAAQRRL